MTTMLTSSAAGEVPDEDDVDSLTIGRRIRQLRLERGMTLEELAAAVDRAPSQLSMIENGRREPKLTLLQAIARALGASLDAILESEPLDERSQLEIQLERAMKGQTFQALGIEPFRYKLFAFVLSGMGAGLAGALMAVFMRFVSPDTLAWTKSGELMIMIILGGVGTFVGPIFGAAAFIILQTYLASWTEHWQLVLGILLLVVVLGTKGGISGVFAHFRKRAA